MAAVAIPTHEGVVQGPRRREQLVAPGWECPSWVADDDADLSDGEVDAFAADVGGTFFAYTACVKLPSEVYKAGVRVRWSRGPEGMQRHEIPRGYHQAMRHVDAARLWEAMLREYGSRQECRSWELRPASECYDDGRQPIECMWVYDCKIDKSTGEFMMWKARLVARGDQSVYLRDYVETYAGVARISTFRIFLAVAAHRRLRLAGSDVSIAFLNAP